MCKLVLEALFLFSLSTSLPASCDSRHRRTTAPCWPYDHPAGGCRPGSSRRIGAAEPSRSYRGSGNPPSTEASTGGRLMYTEFRKIVPGWELFYAQSPTNVSKVGEFGDNTTPPCGAAANGLQLRLSPLRGGRGSCCSGLRFPYTRAE